MIRQTLPLTSAVSISTSVSTPDQSKKLKAENIILSFLKSVNVFLTGYTFTLKSNKKLLFAAGLVLPSSVTYAQTIEQVTVCEGSQATMQVTEVPQHSEVRQWQVSSNGATGSYSDISGAASLTLTFVATAADNGKHYRIKFSNTGNQQTEYSKIFRLTVQSLPSAPAVTHGSREGIGPVTLSASAPSGHTFRWYAVEAGGTPLNSTSSSTFTTPDLSSTTTYYVSVVNTSGCESARAAVIATVTGVNSTSVTNTGLISNHEAAKPIDALKPVAPETESDIKEYTIIKLPDPVQGKLFLSGTAVAEGQTITPAQAKQLSFDPEPTFYGNASFTYNTTNTQHVVNKTMVIYSIPVNAAPIARNVSSDFISSGKEIIQLPTLRGIDLDGSIKEYTIQSLPASGILYANASGTITIKAGDKISSNVLYYNPNQNNKNQLTLTFNYTATDNKGVISSPGTYYLYIEVNPPVIPPVANNITIAAISNAVTTQQAINPLTATDANGYITGFKIESLPTSGTLYINGVAVTSSNLATVYPTSVGQLGGLTYLPVNGFSGNSTFTFTATDDQNATSVVATYTIPVSAPPVVTNVSSEIDALDPTPQLINRLEGSDKDGYIANYIILSLPRGSEGILYLNNTQVTTGQVLSPAQASELRFKRSDSYSNYATFTYTATDDKNIKAANPATYTLRTTGISALPVELISFTGSSTTYKVTLQWKTASELNNDHFEIERSADGKIFTKIGTVQGNGTTKTLSQYTFTDTKPLPEISYYRLKQVDYDGTAQYSKIISIKSKELSENTELQAYPNPFAEKLLVSLTAPETEQAVLTLYNLQGRQCQRMDILLEKGINTYSLDTQQLEKGIYILKVTGSSTDVTTKVLKR